jgi:signal transduction histidine kinase
MDQVFSMFAVNPIYRQKNAEGQKVILRYDKSKDNITIMSDPVWLKQILISMIDNALKFTEKGFVYFGFSIKNEELTFYVMDSGIGTPKDKTEAIFDRFTQLEYTFYRKNNEAGYDLAVSKGLTRLLNGKLKCVSHLGKGTNYYFTIPYRTTTHNNFFPNIIQNN